MESGARDCKDGGFQERYTKESFPDEGMPLLRETVLPPQLDAIEEVDPNIILLTSEETMFGFPCAAIKCLAFQDPCGCKKALTKSREQFDELRVDFGDLFRAMDSRVATSPEIQKIVMTGYSHQLLNDPNQNLDLASLTFRRSSDPMKPISNK